MPKRLGNTWERVRFATALDFPLALRYAGHVTHLARFTHAEHDGWLTRFGVFLLARYLHLDFKPLMGLVEEFRSHRLWNEVILPHVPNASARELGIFRLRYPAAILYVLVRCLKPRTVVETGVAWGVSSATILTALEANGTGTLRSIDLPVSAYDQSRVPEHQRMTILPPEVGCLVPPRLRKSWDLRLGPSQQLLPTLLQELGSIDLFFHDSDHSYDTMRWEFDLAWRHLADRGCLLSDDTDWNTAFEEFSAEQGVSPLFLQEIGLLRKP